MKEGDFYPDEAIGAYAWPLLLQAGGLAELAGTKLQLTARGRKALASPPHNTIRELWRKWVSAGVIDEFSRVDTIKGQRITNVLSSVKGRRATVSLALSGLPAGEWITTEKLFATMRARRHDPDLARNSRSLWRLYVADPQYGSLGYEGNHAWSILQGRYTLAVIFEYAATLGLVDVEYDDPAGAREDYRHIWGADDLKYLSRYDGLRAIRVNDLGAYVLGITDTPPTAGTPSAALRVLPNHEVVALGDLPAGETMTLDAFAERTGDRTWRLSAASLGAGVAAGRGLDELRSLLASANDGPVPRAVTRLLADAAARGSALTDRGVVRLVECADPATAVLVARDRRTRAYCFLLGDRHLAVGAEHELAFRAALSEIGHGLPPSAG